MLFSALLFSTAAAQLGMTYYSNDDCTGDQNVVVKAAGPCINDGLCMMGIKIKCLPSQPSEAIEAPDSSLPYVVQNTYTGAGCSSGFGAQSSFVADGKCRKFGPLYFKVSCAGSTVTTQSYFDSSCSSKVSSATVEADSCQSAVTKEGQQFYQKAVCVGTGSSKVDVTAAPSQAPTTSAASPTATNNPAATNSPAVSNATQASGNGTVAAPASTTTAKSNAVGKGIAIASVLSMVVLNL